MQNLNDYIRILLREEADLMIFKLYKLTEPSSEATLKIADAFTVAIKAGITQLKNQQQIAPDSQLKDILHFVQGIAAWYRRATVTLEKCFESNQMIRNRLLEGIKKFVNTNNPQFRVGELFAISADQVIRGKEKLLQSDAENLLESIVKVVRLPFYYCKDTRSPSTL